MTWADSQRIALTKEKAVYPERFCERMKCLHKSPCRDHCSLCLRKSQTILMGSGFYICDFRIPEVRKACEAVVATLPDICSLEGK